MTISYETIHDDISELLASHNKGAIKIRALPGAELRDDFARFVTPAQAAWLDAIGWKAKPGSHALLPGETGIAEVIFALGDAEPSPASALALGALPAILPEGTYELSDFPGAPEDAVLAWLLGAYEFRRYFTRAPKPIRALVLPEGVDRAAVIARAQAVWFARELINIPANDLGPSDLADAFASMARVFKAEVKILRGAAFLEKNFPLLQTVGRASTREPCLAELHWGNTKHPKVTLVGKGICFDTGGLDIKPSPAMALMKKDMGGAASVIALGAMIMAAKLPVRLRVLVPTADNNISGNAFRPGDIIKSRAGVTVEIGNTDAEGRLVLADALAYADEDGPDLMIDMATLTGAARVALGPDLPPFYTEDEDLAAAVYKAGANVGDPLWRLPFWMPYDRDLKSKVADVNHISNSPLAGSITAALFLKRFVKNAKRYVHLDIFGWTPRALPGKPMGGEPQGARALFEVIRNEYGRGA
ncbi:leucyl aminopeptidase family protein [Rhodomicrobium vannielii ATCC 17100]|uniref:leucyl aminopeptidase family protein n=1 Tax=Rhodomicrobium vannielii TaxID=1069 RepID=UPI0019181BFB|nr:leucyl aminopeptidase family protein [Rhodomicrobium vannielii]MBJ7536029.1 leucyl aminopeptidase family protein [Rhodomicrobium vannielii ATCC 17100]